MSTLRNSIVLIGVSSYTQELTSSQAFDSYKQIDRNIDDLRTILPEALQPLEFDIHEVRNPTSRDALLDPVIQASRSSDGVLLIYYCGHAVLSDKFELTLTHSSVSRDVVEFQGLEYTKLRDAINHSPHGTRIVILDCCFSGAALENGLGDADIKGIVAPRSGLLITSSPSDKPSFVFGTETHTAFTERLIRNLRKPPRFAATTQTWSELMDSLRRSMRRDGLPEPQMLDLNNSANEIKLRRPASPTGQTDNQGVGLVTWTAETVKAELLNRMRDSGEIRIFGVAGPLLLSALREARQEGWLEHRRVVYCTTRPPAWHYQSSAASLGALLQPWTRALKELPRFTGTGDHLDVDTKVALEPMEGCLVEFCPSDPGDAPTVVGLDHLPSTCAPNDTVLWSAGSFSSELSRSLHATLTQSMPYLLREVYCNHVEGQVAAPAGDPPHFKVTSLLEYGTTVTNRVLMPISVVCVKSQTPDGLVAFLQWREPGRESSDTGRISLLSTRILEHDLVAGYREGQFDISHTTKQVADLWISLGKPRPFDVPLDAFLRAAQREMYMSCGLDLPSDRFRFAGYHVLERDDSALQMGFVIYEVELARGTTIDEHQFLERRGGGRMLSLPVQEIWSSSLQLNNLLIHRRGWLEENIYKEG